MRGPIHIMVKRLFLPYREIGLVVLLWPSDCSVLAWSMLHSDVTRAPSTATTAVVVAGIISLFFSTWPNIYLPGIFLSSCLPSDKAGAATMSFNVDHSKHSWKTKPPGNEENLSMHKVYLPFFYVHLLPSVLHLRHSPSSIYPPFPTWGRPLAPSFPLIEEPEFTPHSLHHLLRFGGPH